MKAFAFIGLFLLLSESPKVPDLTGSQSIVINYKWMGLSDIAIINANSTLQFNDSIWTGKSDISIAFDLIKTSYDVTIPSKVIDSILMNLSGISVSLGEYEPKITHFDDYPEVLLSFNLENDTAVFYSASQGKHHLPWEFTISGKSFVLKSRDASMAFDKFWEICGFNKLDSLVTLKRRKDEK